MTKAKIVITINPVVLSRLDAWVKGKHCASCSAAIKQAVKAHLQSLERTRLAAQCVLLNVDDEQAVADMGLAADSASWLAF